MIMYINIQYNLGFGNAISILKPIKAQLLIIGTIATMKNIATTIVDIAEYSIFKIQPMQMKKKDRLNFIFRVKIKVIVSKDN